MSSAHPGSVTHSRSIVLRVFAISDLHIDFEENRKWLFSLSKTAYQDDILILAGDLTDIEKDFNQALEFLKACFKEVCFVPGNHDIWVWRDRNQHSLDKFDHILSITRNLGIHTKPLELDNLIIVPLFGWYDYSLAPLSEKLKTAWTDYKACVWPDGFDDNRITEYFLALNRFPELNRGKFMISFSHFLPRIDLMPSFIPEHKRLVFPVLGTTQLEHCIRKLGSEMHIYGHSHVNRQVVMEDVAYINNAFGYPHETRITSKRLLCVYDCDKQEALRNIDSVGNRIN